MVLETKKVTHGTLSIPRLRVEGNSKQNTHELVTGVPELEVRRRGRELVDELVDCGRKARVFVTLQVRLQVILRITLVDLS